MWMCLFFANNICYLLKGNTNIIVLKHIKYTVVISPLFSNIEDVEAGCKLSLCRITRGAWNACSCQAEAGWSCSAYKDCWS